MTAQENKTKSPVKMGLYLINHDVATAAGLEAAEQQLKELLAKPKDQISVKDLMINPYGVMKHSKGEQVELPEEIGDELCRRKVVLPYQSGEVATTYEISSAPHLNDPKNHRTIEFYATRIS